MFHSSATASHSGVHATTKWISSFCYWKGLENDVRVFIQSCDICQRCKYDNAAYLKSYGREVIMVVVDRITKYTHFIILYHLFSAATITEAFINNVFKLHGMPMLIVSDRDAIFLSNFWHNLFCLQRCPYSYQHRIIWLFPSHTKDTI